MIVSDEIIEIGQFNKTHGVNGELTATVLCSADEIRKFTALVCQMEGIYVPFFVNQVRNKTAQTLLITLDGVDSEHKARRFVNKKIYVLRGEFSDEGEVYCDYFIGFNIKDADGCFVGTITDVDDSTENALFIVENNGESFLIPISEDFIQDIDEAKKIIVMTLPEGLISSQLDKNM